MGMRDNPLMHLDTKPERIDTESDSSDNRNNQINTDQTKQTAIELRFFPVFR